MITNEAIRSSIPLVQALNAKGLNVVPIENSPLAALVNATGGVEITSTEGGDLDLLYLTAEIANSTNDVSGVVPNQHNIISDELAPAIGAKLRNHIAYAKNVVSPNIEALATKTKAIMDGFSPSELLGLEITTFTAPKLFGNPALLSSAQQVAEVKFDAGYALPFAMPMISAEDLIKIISENVSGLGKDLEIWIGALGNAKIEEIYRDFFTNESKLIGRVTIGGFVNQLGGLGGGVSCDIDKLLAVHLMARALFTAVPAGLEISIAKYETEFAYLRDITGSRLYSEAQAHDAAIASNDVLIKSIDGQKVMVYEENYKRFLDEGGDNEVIFGALVSNSRLFRVKELIDARAALETAWNRQLGIVSVTEANRRFVRVKGTLRNVFAKMMAEEKEVDPQLNLDPIIKLFDQELDSLVEKDMECIYTLSTRLLCRSRYAHTDAEMILEGINRVCKENPKLDVREAAAISAINYCAYWLFSQLRVV